MVANTLVKHKKTFSVFMTSDAVKNKVNQMMSGAEGNKFITSLISLVANNQQLAECDQPTILASALVGQSLKLSPSPQLGQFYIVPFKDKKRGTSVATFQLGYKGYIQLAMRSGEYKDLDVVDVREGEYKGKDRFTGKPVIEFIEDDVKRESLPIVGYYAYFELLNGFKKSLYWTRQKMQKHAEDYSQAYRYDIKWNSSNSFWTKNFDEMAYKTMLRQLISKWGIMSVDFQNAIASDMAVIDNNGNAEYVDNVSDDDVIEAEQVTQEVNQADDEPDPLDDFDD